MRGAVAFYRPDFHLSETLPAELGLSAERLLDGTPFGLGHALFAVLAAGLVAHHAGREAWTQAGAHRWVLGASVLLLGSTISGILSMQHIRNLRGIGLQKTHENAVTTGKVSHLSFLNGELLLETDNAALKKINLRGEALGDIAG